ncbi:MAG: hypothetical protein CL946_08960 [Ectothiorhodospiraceae bacterium]|jgi:hypothetical protein|nr:hypothetical protein [Ectothiorhodospiraceae bacterium]|tara:strand:+ start:131 stop:481 length:351 start_codon:yes stop_codon:yes gene_type:complete
MDTDSLDFIPYNGDTGELYSDDNHLIFKWCGEGHIIASLARKGNAISAHLSSDKKGLRHLKTAINDFCVFVFWLFDWCEMVLAQINRPSVERVVTKCGFSYLATAENGVKVYMRVK